ncbi:MAG: hypothetical protein HFJ54_03350 [Clostridia bacterium]|nr:hypothetical protein [Clostridia bacterium]
MKNTKPNKSDRGITLIVLVVTVILLIILTVVSIRAIAGEEGIIRVSSEATEDYNILQYKEQIEQLRESIILKAEITGENIKLEKIAREMSKEATWIKSAVANVKEGVAELNDDIIVTTTDGYIFQLYYNESYGQKFIEYLGKENGETIPELIVSKVDGKITVVSTENTSGINGIEVIYKGEIVKSEKTSTLEYEAAKTGWYAIRATSNKGKLRYAWVRVSSTIAAPKIEIINPSVEAESSWYKSKVTVRITAVGDKTSKIYYTTSRWKEDPALEITASDQINGSLGKDIEIALQGITSIYAYAVDGNDGESEIVRQDILIDSEPPVINNISITGTKGENGWYRGEVGISLKNAKDNASGIAGYYYYIPTEEEISSNFIPEINEMKGENEQVGGNAINIKTIMKITEDGIKTAIVRVQDRAGNITDPVTITVKADNTPPSPTPVLKQTTEEDLKQDGFILKIERESADISTVTYDYYGIVDGKEQLLGSTREKEIQVSGLKSDTSYTVYVNARDEAGNIAYGTENGIILKTKKALPQPSIIIEKLDGTQESNGWYMGDVKVKISYIADQIYGDLKLKYRINGESERTSSNTIAEVGTISNEGITIIEAYTENSGGEKSTVTTEEIKIDTTSPEKPIITVNGTTGDGEWYGANMQIVIQGGADNGAGAAKIKYKVIPEGESEDNINWITEGRSTVTTEIRADGIYKIKAITIDRAGRESEMAERDIKKDSIAPIIESFIVQKSTSYTIVVKANGIDNLSGIHSYTFQHRLYGTSNWMVDDTIEIEERTNRWNIYI